MKISLIDEVKKGHSGVHALEGSSKYDQKHGGSTNLKQSVIH